MLPSPFLIPARPDRLPVASHTLSLIRSWGWGLISDGAREICCSAAANAASSTMHGLHTGSINKRVGTPEMICRSTIGPYRPNKFRARGEPAAKSGLILHTSYRQLHRNPCGQRPSVDLSFRVLQMAFRDPAINLGTPLRHLRRVRASLTRGEADTWNARQRRSRSYKGWFR